MRGGRHFRRSDLPHNLRQPVNASFKLLNRLHHHASARPGAAAYRCVRTGVGDAAIDWLSLDRSVRAFAGSLSKHLSHGQTLLISSANGIEVVVAILAGFAAGLRVFPVTCEASDDELMRLATQSEAAGVVGSAGAISLLKDNVKHAWPIDSLLRFCEEAPGFAETPGSLILQSSGTTGFPRLVHRDAPSIDAVSNAMVESIGFSESDRVLALLPLSHSYGIEHGLLAPVWSGAEVILGHGLDLNIIQTELPHTTIFPTVPSAVEILTELPGATTELPHLRRIYSAGSPLPRSVFDRFLSRYRIRVSQLYGATEVGSVTYNAADHPDFDPASVGDPMRGVEIRIADPLHPEKLVPARSEGHVHIHAASMFGGYLDQRPALVDGFFPTGDLGSLDAAGRLTITGRLKLLIDVGGLKVNPVEVETVLREHPLVGSCIVVPMRQSETVYRVKAIVTPRDPSRPPSVEDLRALARQKLATYKVPRAFEIRPSLPTTPTGKVLRHLVT